MRLPVGFMEQIIEYRAYIGAARPFLPESPLVDLAKQIAHELAQEEVDEINGR